MEWYESEVRDIEAARKVKKPVPRPVVFYGSSSIRLWTDIARDLCSERVVNAGFGGSTLAACAYFFERLVVPLAPSSLVVYAGDNDIGDGRRPAEVFDSFRQLIAKKEAQLGAIPFGFLSIKLSPARFGLARRIRETNEMVREEISRHPGAYFVDMGAGMLDREGRPRPELYLEDGLHLSASGYHVWTANLNAVRNKIFISESHPLNPEALSCKQNEPGVSQVVQSSTEP